MTKNLGVIYPKHQDYQSYQREVSKILEKGNEYFEAHKERLKEIPWVFDKKLCDKVKFPSITHSFAIYCGLYFLLEGKMDKEALIKTFFDDKQDYIKEILIRSIEDIPKKQDKKDSIRESINAILMQHQKTGKITLIKGSIYKIKRYFLENNSLSDIRGGSIIIDYLNKECIDTYLVDSKNELCKECLIYSGGGNILLMVPSGQGEKVCSELEATCHHVALTAMNAFEFIETDIYELLFNFKEITGNLSKKLEERKKNKMYNFEPQPIDLDKLTINNKSIDLKGKRSDRKSICKLCDIREGYYEEIVDNEYQAICPSCYRKHVIGRNAKSKYTTEYEAYLAKHHLSGSPYQIKTLDEMKDKNGMIAVLYGDGNNMGNIVLNIEKPYEMMYFSDRTDQITKESVYGAIHEIMKEDERFEILAVGGDDLFFIVPAQYALDLAAEVVRRFDTAFNEEGTIAKEATTMSVGICIGKYNMPIKSMFEIAQDNLKNAKKVVRGQIINEPDSKEIEGTIDVVEMNGGQTIINDDSYSSIFPIKASKLTQILKQSEGMEEIKMRIYDYEYAQKTMIKDEFRLYFNYKEAKMRNSNKTTVAEYLRNIFGENVNLYLQNILGANSNETQEVREQQNEEKTLKIWSDLLLLLKYRRDV